MRHNPGRQTARTPESKNAQRPQLCRLVPPGPQISNLVPPVGCHGAAKNRHYAASAGSPMPPLRISGSQLGVLSPRLQGHGKMHVELHTMNSEYEGAGRLVGLRMDAKPPNAAKRPGDAAECRHQFRQAAKRRQAASGAAKPPRAAKNCRLVAFSGTLTRETKKSNNSIPRGLIRSQSLVDHITLVCI